VPASPAALVSVVIPTFQRTALLPRALESVRRQTRPADEVIVVDDGSTDEWIALLDSDDVWRPEKLARQLAALAANPKYRICHSDEIWIRDGRRVNQGRRHAKRGGWIFRHCLPLCAISPSSVLIHRTVLNDVGLFDEQLPACEDYDLWLRITARYPVLLVDEPLVEKHGGHADQLSRTVPGLDRYRIRALERILGEECLGPKDQAAAVAMLQQKCRIWAAGAAARGRLEEAAGYRELARHWGSTTTVPTN
jgi:glycosyltransferase involved in cell wall biosynthesis